MKITKSKIQFLLTLFVGAGAYLFILYRIIAQTDLKTIFRIISNLHPLGLITGVLLSILMVIFQSLFLKKSFHLFGLNLTLKQALVSWLVASATGIATFGLSGPAIFFLRAYDKGATYKKALFITFVYYFLYFSACIFFIAMITASLSFFLRDYLDSRFPYLLLSGLLLALFILFLDKFFSRAVFKFLSYRLNIQPQFLEGLNFKIEWLNLLELLTLGFCSLASQMAIFVLSLQIFGVKLLLLLILEGFLLFLVLALFSPSGSGLGFVEFGLLAFLNSLGIFPGRADFIILTYRFLSFWIPVLLGFLVLSYKGGVFLSRSRDRLLLR